MSGLKQFFLFAVTASFALLLAGCSGDDKNKAQAPAPMPPTPRPPTEFAGLRPPTAGYAAIAASRVADARPRSSGSITQSSNVNNGITVDRVMVTAQHGANRNEYSIRNGSSWSISTSDGNLERSAASARFDTQELNKRINGGTLYVGVYSDIEAPGSREVPPSGTITLSPDTDYLAGGIWLFVPDNATSADDVVFGAFGDGNDPFRQSNIVALSGTARYVGAVLGAITNLAENAVAYWDGEVTLTADFGGRSDLGSISGSLTNLRVGSATASDPLSLGRANIGFSNSGFFEGRLSGIIAGVGINGRWGGQFYGNSEADGKPGSVGGTLAGRSQDRSKSLLGGFVAYRQ